VYSVGSGDRLRPPSNLGINYTRGGARNPMQKSSTKASSLSGCNSSRQVDLPITVTLGHTFLSHETVSSRARPAHAVGLPGRSAAVAHSRPLIPRRGLMDRAFAGAQCQHLALRPCPDRALSLRRNPARLLWFQRHQAKYPARQRVRIAHLHQLQLRRRSWRSNRASAIPPLSFS
jgi:hypothetical protein